VGNQTAWAKFEAAKRRLNYRLLNLELPVISKNEQSKFFPNGQYFLIEQVRAISTVPKFGLERLYAGIESPGSQLLRVPLYFGSD
jgi:hypothetical protein